MPMYAIVHLKQSMEFTVIPANWLNEQKTQCYWPPFKTPEKCLDVMKNRLEPERVGNWELLNILFQGECATYEQSNDKCDAVREQVERPLYAVITLQESNELTVIPTNWLNEQKTQCYWPPFKTPENCFFSIKNRLEPKKGINPWKLYNIVFYGEHANYEEAKKEHKAIGEQLEQPSTLNRCFERPEAIHLSTPLKSQSCQTFGVKRKYDDESPDISTQSLLTTDMDPKKKAKEITERIKEKVQAIQGKDHTITLIKKHILYAISKMNKVTRKKATIGIFGRTGEGKSSLLNAVLGEQFLLPSGGFGACTAVLIQVEANLNDDNYVAEIDLISKQEWEEELALPGKDDDNQLSEMIKERIAAVYGSDAEEKTLEELKRDDRYIEINKVLSDGLKTIISSDPTEFANTVRDYLEHRVENSGGCYWPLVKSVTIKIPKCAELLEHIVLIDIPGTGDCDKIRDDLWKTKIRECSSVWIVSDIKRAITDRDPWGIVEHCIEDLGPGGECKSINFICTKTDIINPSEYLRSRKLTEAQITGHGLDVKTKCILHRNDTAKKTINHKLKSSKSNESKKRFVTDVFTVSSTAYFDQESHLNHSETEIPKLRDILINLNKIINQKLTRDYINEAKGILSLIQSVQLDKDNNKTKPGILKDLLGNLQKELKMLQDHFEDLYENLKHCLSNGVKESKRSCLKTTQDMLSSVRPKNNRGFHKIFRAMCQRGGFYWPKNKKEPLDLNKCLAKHMYDSINQDFELIFPVDDNDKTEKSVQGKLDEFNIIKNFYPTSPILHHIQNFIQTQETMLKASLSRDILERKKEIYATMSTTIQSEMEPGYESAIKKRGDGCMQMMENEIIETIERLNPEMFIEAKVKMLKMFNNLKLHVIYSLESELKTSVERSLSQISEITHLDVSREIQELEKLSQQEIEVNQEFFPRKCPNM